LVPTSEAVTCTLAKVNVMADNSVWSTLSLADLEWTTPPIPTISPFCNDISPLSSDAACSSGLMQISPNSTAKSCLKGISCSAVESTPLTFPEINNNGILHASSTDLNLLELFSSDALTTDIDLYSHDKNWLSDFISSLPSLSDSLSDVSGEFVSVVAQNDTTTCADNSSHITSLATPVLANGAVSFTAIVPTFPLLTSNNKPDLMSATYTESLVSAVDTLCNVNEKLFVESNNNDETMLVSSNVSPVVSVLFPVNTLLNARETLFVEDNSHAADFLVPIAPKELLEPSIATANARETLFVEDNSHAADLLVPIAPKELLEPSIATATETVFHIDHGSPLYNTEDAQNSENERITQVQNMPVQSVSETKIRRRKESKASVNAVVRKKSRMSGNSYIGFRKDPQQGLINVEKASKNMLARCEHQTACKYACSNVSEDARQRKFDEFWKLDSWLAKKSFVRGLVATRLPIVQRRHNRLNPEVSKRKPKELIRDCYLATETGQKVLVCRKFFLNTLCIGRNQFLSWTKEWTDTEHKDPKYTVCLKKQMAADWIDALPKVPSHYCRSSSTRTYVEASFITINRMYLAYCDYAKEHSTDSICRQLFSDILEEKKISIHKPRKDQCDVCCGYTAGSVNTADYEEHMLKAREAEMAKAEAKENCSPTNIVITVDVQSVLMCPRLLVSTAYYKKKLQVHNYTIFRLNDKEVSLYVWDESSGGVTCNEFTSCLIDYIESLPNSVNEVTIISDGCSYQNRNKTLSSALRDLSVRRKIVIQQIILEKGHTMMECDSIHSTLDGIFKRSLIYTPENYVTIMRLARRKQPYDVKHVTHEFFRNYDALPGNIKSLRPGNIL
jgi:hypothetical protein